jgi:AcrR family transcriptional regulator
LTRDARRALTRRNLISAAIDVFTEQGFDAATIEEIGRRAQVSRTAFYFYFTNKVDVIMAIGSLVGESINTYWLSLASLDRLDAASLAEWLAGYLRAWSEHPGWLIVAMQGNVSNVELTQGGIDGDIAAVEALLRAFEDAGWRRRQGAAAELFVIRATIQRLFFPGAAFNVSFPLPDTVDAIARHLEYALSRSVVR